MEIKIKYALLAIIIIMFLISSTNIVFAVNNDNIKIKQCLISTGDVLNERTYAKIYVGEGHSNEKVKIQIFYTLNGKKLNKGNKVKVKVDKTGCIEVYSANPLKKYPDQAKINIYNSKGNKLLDSKIAKLSTTRGIQLFAVTKKSSYSSNNVKYSSSSKNNYNRQSICWKNEYSNTLC